MQTLGSTAELSKSGGVLSEDKHVLWEKAFCLPEPSAAVFQSSLKPLAQHSINQVRFKFHTSICNRGSDISTQVELQRDSGTLISTNSYWTHSSSVKMNLYTTVSTFQQRMWDYFCALEVLSLSYWHLKRVHLLQMSACITYMPVVIFEVSESSKMKGLCGVQSLEMQSDALITSFQNQIWDSALSRASTITTMKELYYIVLIYCMNSSMRAVFITLFESIYSNKPSACEQLPRQSFFFQSSERWTYWSV